MPVLLSYRNQLIDLHNKIIDWFLSESNTGIEWLKDISNGIWNDINVTNIVTIICR